MKHKLIEFGGTELGTVYLYGPIPYIGYTFTLEDKAYKVLLIQGAALKEIAKGEVDVILVVTEIPKVY